MDTVPFTLLVILVIFAFFAFVALLILLYEKYRERKAKKHLEASTSEYQSVCAFAKREKP